MERFRPKLEKLKLSDSYKEQMSKIHELLINIDRAKKHLVEQGKENEIESTFLRGLILDAINSLHNNDLITAEKWEELHKKLEQSNGKDNAFTMGLIDELKKIVKNTN